MRLEGISKVLLIIFILVYTKTSNCQHMPRTDGFYLLNEMEDRPSVFTHIRFYEDTSVIFVRTFDSFRVLKRWFDSTVIDKDKCEVIGNKFYFTERHVALSDMNCIAFMNSQTLMLDCKRLRYGTDTIKSSGTYSFVKLKFPKPKNVSNP